MAPMGTRATTIMLKKSLGKMPNLMPSAMRPSEGGAGISRVIRVYWTGSPDTKNGAGPARPTGGQDEQRIRAGSRRRSRRLVLGRGGGAARGQGPPGDHPRFARAWTAG